MMLIHCGFYLYTSRSRVCNVFKSVEVWSW